MMRFLQLCLLLATVQLLLVSAEVIPLPEGINVTFSLPGNFESCTKHGCGNTVSCVSELSQGNNNVLTLYDLGLSDSGTYCCRTSNDNCSLELRVVRGCIKSFLTDVDFTHTCPPREINGTTINDCMKACTYSKDCQYFTFQKSDKKCFLMESKTPLKIGRNKDAVSGYSRKSCCTTEFNIYGGQGDSAEPESYMVNSSLRLYNDTRSWFDALGFCRTNHSTLFQFTDDTVRDEVGHLMGKETTTHNGVWVGLERSIFGCDTTWRWISGGNVSFPQWNSSTAPSSSNKYCGKMIWVNETQTIKLVDDDCFENLPFICQAGPA